MSVSSDTLSSLRELSVELKSLGLKPLISNNAIGSEELCEALLNSAWMLINMVHSGSMGLNCSQNSSDREALLRSEKQSLELKLEALRKELSSKEDMLAKALNNVYRLQEEKKVQDLTVQKQSQLITQLKDKLESQENSYHHEIFRLEAQCEQLREMVRKSTGVGSRSLSPGRTLDHLSTLNISDFSEELKLLKSAQERLKSSNAYLIEENLMLRDALKFLHHDINQVLRSCKHPESEPTDLQSAAFHLPAEFSYRKLKEFRQQQINTLYKTLALNTQT